MPILGDDFLAEMGALGAELLLKDECLVTRPPGDDEYPAGTRWHDSGNVLVDIQLCAVVQPSARELEGVERVATYATWDIYLPLGTDVQEADILLTLNRSFTVKEALDQSYNVFKVVRVAEFS